MNANLQLAGACFAPGEDISGEISWQAGAAPRRAELRLFWQTKGKGDRDCETAWETSFYAPLSEDRRSFSLRAPARPPSFSGKLVSLVWAMELIIDGKGVKVEELVIAPGGIEMNLDRPDWLVIEAPWEALKIPWFQKT